MSNAGVPIPHARLLQGVWRPEYGVELGYIRMFVRQLRTKIEDDPSHPPRYLADGPICRISLVGTCDFWRSCASKNRDLRPLKRRSKFEFALVPHLFDIERPRHLKAPDERREFDGAVCFVYFS